MQDRNSPLKKLNDVPAPSGEKPPLNGLGPPSPERAREAVREANDPRRLVSTPGHLHWPPR